MRVACSVPRADRVRSALRADCARLALRDFRIDFLRRAKNIFRRSFLAWREKVRLTLVNIGRNACGVCYKKYVLFLSRGVDGVV